MCGGSIEYTRMYEHGALIYNSLARLSCAYLNLDWSSARALIVEKAKIASWGLRNVYRTYAGHTQRSICQSDEYAKKYLSMIIGSPKVKGSSIRLARYLQEPNRPKGKKNPSFWVFPYLCHMLSSTFFRASLENELPSLRSYRRSDVIFSKKQISENRGLGPSLGKTFCETRNFVLQNRGGRKQIEGFQY